MKLKTALISLNLLALLGAPSIAHAVYKVDHVPEGFVLQTHRCAGKIGPENTLESCHFAWSHGTIPEVDVRTTADGIPVAFHDKNMKRVVDGVDEADRGRGIESFTYRELQQFDVGIYMGEYFRGQRIPLLATIFSAMQGHPERKLYMDIKLVPLPFLASMVYDFGVEKQVIVASTHHSELKEWKELVPESGTLHWMGGKEEDLDKRIELLRKENYAGITQLQIHARVVDLQSENPFTPSSAFFRKVGADLKERGILFQSLPWGTAEPLAYWRLMDLGVQSFATDYPQQTLQAINDYYLKNENE